MKSLYTLVGMQHIDGADALVLQLRRGDQLMLLREPENRFDPNAVQVWARGKHVGFIKAKEVKPLAAHMDRLQVGTGGISFFGRLAIIGSGWPMVEVDDSAAAQRSREIPG